jgi:hypothetical protein
MRHAIPVIVHKNIGPRTRGRRIDADAMSPPAREVPHRCIGERSFGGAAGCPNAAQPELSIVSTPLLGLAAGDGKGGAEVRFGLTAPP